MGVGMDGLGLGRCAEKLRHLRISILLRLFGKGQIFPVRLTLSGKRLL